MPPPLRKLPPAAGRLSAGAIRRRRRGMRSTRRGRRGLQCFELRRPDIGSEQEDADTRVVNLCQGALGLRVRAVDDDDDFDARVGLVQCGLHGFHD